MLSCPPLPDIDDLLAYNTIKYVRIRDARLGAMRLVFQLGILVYIVALVLVRDGGYCAKEQPLGTVQFDFMQPTVNCSMQERAHESAFGNVTCVTGCPKRGWGTGVLTPQHCYDHRQSVQELPYCRQYTGDPALRAGAVLDCEMEEGDIVGKKWEPSLLFTTVFTRTRQVRACAAALENPLYQGGNCDDVFLPQDSGAYTAAEWQAFKNDHPWAPEVATPQVYFVAGIEDFKIVIDHTVQAATLGLYSTATSMHGRLKVESDHDLCSGRYHNGQYAAWTQAVGGERASGAPCYLELQITDGAGGVSAPNLHMLDLGVLLAAGGLRLDDLNHVGGATNATYRQTGTTVVLSIEYSNRNAWEMPTGADIHFEYRVAALRGTAYRQQDHEWVAFDWASGRFVKQLSVRQGVRIVAVQSGMLQAFALQVLLLQLTTSLALLAVASAAVDAIALNLLPHRNEYTAYKFQVTEDFSDLREGKVTIDLEAIKSNQASPIEEADAGAEDSESDDANAPAAAVEQHNHGTLRPRPGSPLMVAPSTHPCQPLDPQQDVQPQPEDDPTWVDTTERTASNRPRPLQRKDSSDF
eukprot:TRINITY_DN15431_c0_g2_i1.p1 TRINITY_DN15431_c0_g2~~TRINITY_DN15431_c0_g2_i1.p1  ORF type:complete len:581 (+),score=162.10 TRINITY_DN15431_c0_g2_i1:75-1817(+)